MQEKQKHYAHVDLGKDEIITLRTLKDFRRKDLDCCKFRSPNQANLPNRIRLSYDNYLGENHSTTLYINRNMRIEGISQDPLWRIHSGDCVFNVNCGCTLELKQLRLGSKPYKSKSVFIINPDSTLIFTDCTIRGATEEPLIYIRQNYAHNTVGDIHIIFQGCKIEDDSIEDLIRIIPNYPETLDGSIHLIMDDTEYNTKRQIIQVSQYFLNVVVRVDTCASPDEDDKTSE